MVYGLLESQPTSLHRLTIPLAPFILNLSPSQPSFSSPLSLLMSGIHSILSIPPSDESGASMPMLTNFDRQALCFRLRSFLVGIRLLHVHWTKQSGYGYHLFSANHTEYILLYKWWTNRL